MINALVLSLVFSATPRLGIIVIFDQLRATDLDRLQPLWGDFGGISNGARFDAFYDYAATETGPGHATIATCANPNVHGIVANHWVENGKPTYAAEESSADRLAVGTFGDALRAESNGASKVVTISLKDRAALLSGGRSTNVALWFDPKKGTFVSRDGALPAWAQSSAVPAALAGGSQWRPLPIAPALAPLLPLDANPHEGGMFGLTDRFPHDLDSIAEADRANAYRGMPDSMHDLFSLAVAAIDGEHLGQGPFVDLLVVSISTTDYVQHWFGPTSAEAADMLRRADRELRAFRAAVAKRVGPVVLAVAADHAGTPVPENIAALGEPAGRIDAKALLARVTTAVQSVSKEAHAIGIYPPHFYLDLAKVPEADRERVLAVAKKTLLASDGIAAVYDPALPPGNDPMERFYRHCIFPGRSGNLLVRQKPRFHFVFDAQEHGSDHGSAYTYDRRIPFIIEGPGVRPGRYAEAVDSRDITPTLAFLLHAPLPEACEGHAVPAVGSSATALAK